MVKRLRALKGKHFPEMSPKWWTDLQNALNLNGLHETLSKEAVDEYDHSVKEGLGILQILCMRKCPTAANDYWSPVLKKVN